MTERNIDIELIMALAEGSLPAEEAAAAEASLSDAARAELASQRTALTALSQMSSTTQSDAERARLRTAVRDEVSLSATPVTALPLRQHQPWYFRALPALGAAAALVVVVGIGVDSIGIGQNDEGVAQPTSVNDLSTEAAELTAATEAASRLQGESTEEGQMNAPLATTGATSAATTMTADAVAEEDGGFDRLMMFPDDLGEISLSDLDQLVELVEQGVTRVVGFAPYAFTALPEAAAQPGLVCWQHVLDQEAFDSEIDYLGIATVDGEQGEVYRTVAVDASTTIYVFVGEECAAAAIVRP